MIGFKEPIAILLIFAILYASLGSVRASLLILANIPFAAVSGMIALAISGEYLRLEAAPARSDELRRGPYEFTMQAS